MKKMILLLLLIIPILSKAQEKSDTLLLSKPVQFETEIYQTKTGKKIEKVYAIYDNTYYESNKTSMDRYKTILRFNGIPTTVLVITGKTKKTKIIVL